MACRAATSSAPLLWMVEQACPCSGPGALGGARLTAYPRATAGPSWPRCRRSGVVESAWGPGGAAGPSPESCAVSKHWVSAAAGARAGPPRRGRERADVVRRGRVQGRAARSGISLGWVLGFRPFVA